MTPPQAKLQPQAALVTSWVLSIVGAVKTTVQYVQYYLQQMTTIFTRVQIDV